MSQFLSYLNPLSGISSTPWAQYLIQRAPQIKYLIQRAPQIKYSEILFCLAVKTLRAGSWDNLF